MESDRSDMNYDYLRNDIYEFEVKPSKNSKPGCPVGTTNVLLRKRARNDEKVFQLNRKKYENIRKSSRLDRKYCIYFINLFCY
jgi:hypothetical protein